MPEAIYLVFSVLGIPFDTEDKKMDDVVGPGPIEKIEEFDGRIATTDEVLLKSIEVSQIHSMFGNPRE